MSIQTVELVDICQTTQGVQITKANTSDANYEGGYRYLYIADFLSDKKLSFIDDKFNAKKVTENDLVMANTGSPGKVFKGKNGILSNNLFKISFDLTVVNRDYLYLILSSDIFQSILQQQMKGGIQKHLGHKTISRQKIPLPSLPKQQKIAEILDAADTLRQKDQQLIDHYTSLSQSLFLDMFGDPLKNSKGWEETTLMDVSEKITDGTHKTPKYVEEGELFLSAKNIKNNCIVLNSVKYITKEEHELLSKRCNVELNDILITKSGSIGMSAMVDIETGFSIFESLALIKYLRDRVDGKFLLYFMNTPTTQYQYSRHTKGVGVKHLHLKDLRKIRMILPPMKLQKQFTKRVEVIEKQKQQAQASLEQSNNLFNSLLQKAFTGELTNKLTSKRSH